RSQRGAAVIGLPGGGGLADNGFLRSAPRRTSGFRVGGDGHRSLLSAPIAIGGCNGRSSGRGCVSGHFLVCSGWCKPATRFRPTTITSAAGTTGRTLPAQQNDRSSSEDVKVQGAAARETRREAGEK